MDDSGGGDGDRGRGGVGRPRGGQGLRRSRRRGAAGGQGDIRRPGARRRLPAARVDLRGAARRRGLRLQGSPRVLPHTGDADAYAGLRHQGRGLASGLGLERQTGGDRQRRLGRLDQLFRTGRALVARLRGGGDRHGPCGQRDFRRLRCRPSREAGRFRLSRRPRHDRRGQGGDPRLLRRWPHEVVLELVLHGRPSGVDGSLPVSGRLRRHLRHGAGQSHDRPDGPELVDRLPGGSRPRRRRHARQAPGPAQGLSVPVRRQGWPCRRDRVGAASLQVRPGHHPVQRR